MTISNHRLSFVKARFAKLNEEGLSVADRLALRADAEDGGALAFRGEGGGTQVSLTTLGSAYTQNFDSLAQTGSTNTTLPTDWFFSESLTNANTSYSAGTGSSNAGDTWSFGVAGVGVVGDRAFGQIRSGNLASMLGATFTNATGGTITSLLISYDGEQWRLGATSHATAERMDFQISFDATSLTTGTWFDINNLDFSPPITTGTVGALDGNAAANRIAISFNVTTVNGNAVSIASGTTFWIRWVDVDATGSDDGLAIDNFSITPGGAAPPAETQTVQFNPTSVTQNEGNSGTTAYSFTVTRTGGTTGQLNFSGTIAAGGTDNADYVGGTAPTTFSGSILAGQTSATVTVNVQGDFTIEGDESFTLTLTMASNTDGTVTVNIGANDDATGTITNDDSAGTISVADVSLAEGNAGTTPGSFTVTRSGGSTGTVTVDYTITLPGGAGGADGSDVSGPLTGTVTFLEGETTASIPFTINGDITNEPNETFTVALSNATGGATIGDGNATATITNDDSQPAASVADTAVVEGDSGVTYLVFTVTLDKPSLTPITYDYATANGSALAGSDYVARSGQITFAAGETSKTISVPVIGDDHSEANETLTLTLSNPSGGLIADGSGTGTITNDDGNAYFALAGGNFSQNWTNTGQITTADNWSGVPFIIGYLGDIDAGSTTNADPRALTGPALGAIDVIPNLANTTSNSGGVGEFEIANPVVGLQGSGTADAPSLVLYMDATGRSDIRFQANLRDIDNSAPGGVEDNAAQQINVQYRTDPNGSWTNVPGAYFADVTALGATTVTAIDVILPAGANNAATLEIRIMTTNAAGSDEWVGIDDIVVSSLQSPPSLSIENAAVLEGDSGATPLSFTVVRNGSSLGTVTANYTVNLGSGPFDANAADFVSGQAFSGLVSFADGQTSATITLNVQGDTLAEGDDNFTVTLSNAVGGTIADGNATGTIVNDDGPPILVTINDVTVVEGDSGTSVMTFTVTRTGGTGAFSVDYQTADGTATAGSDYVAEGGTLNFAAGQTSETITITINGDTASELSETLQVLLSNATNGALITDGTGIGTIASDDPIYIHDIQGTAYFSPILAGEGINSFNVASVGSVIVRAIVTAVDNDGPRQGYYLTEEITDWDGNSYTSEGIFVMTRNDAGVGTVVSGVSVGDLIQISAQVMEYQAFSTMPRTMLVNPTGFSLISSGNALPTITLTNMPNAVMTGVTPDYLDSADGAGDTFDASVYALSYFETVEGMLVTIPNMVVADGFVSASGGRPFLQAYSLDSANPDQINSRGGYTIAGDPPVGPPDTAETGDDTIQGGRHLHDGDVNPDIIELDFTGWAMAPPAGLAANATMGDLLGDVTGIIDFDFTDRKLFVTGMEPGGFVNGGIPVQETTALGNDGRSLTIATFNVENLDPGDGAARFTALANVIATNLNAPDIICIEEMQDNNGATATGGADASTSWQMLVNALNLATGKVYQWVDQEPNGSEGGEPGGNIRVGFLYDTGRVQLGDLAPNATLAERRMYTDRIGDGVRDAGDLIQFSDNMLGAEISASDWAGTRRSLLGEFTFNGNTVFVTANHWPAKGGSGEFWQFNQNLETGDPDNSGWAQRNRVAQDVYAMMNLIQSSDPEAGIAAGGDFNDFYFYRPLTTVTGYTMADGTARVGGARFDNLTLTLSEAERYTYTFDGRSQAIDHIIVNELLSGVASYDVVHINTGYNASGTGPDASPRLSDHDPALSSFDFRNFSEVLNGTAGNDTIEGFGGNDVITGGAGDDLIDGGPGNDTAVYAGNIADYAIVGEYDGEGNLIGFLQVTDINGVDGDEGSDTLVSVETLRFADATYSALDPVELYDFDGNLVGTFATIQAAVDDAANGYSVVISAGTYVEQVVVNGINGLTIRAADGDEVIVQAPANLAVTGTSAYFGDSVRAGITIIDSDNVTLLNLKVDGSFAGDTTPGSNGDEISGVALLGSSGTIDGVEIYDTGNSQGGGLFGLQHGSGLFVDGTSGADLVVLVTNSNIHDFQKTGALIVGVNVTFEGNMVTGIGGTALTAQNAIQIALSSGSIADNAISGIGYSGGNFYGSGIIAYEPSGALSITGNTITGAGAAGSAAGIDLSDVLGIEVEITGNSFANLDYGIYAYTFTGGAIGLDANPLQTGNSFANIGIEGVHLDPEESYGAPFTTATAFLQSGSDFPDFLAGSLGNDALSGLGGDDRLEGRDGSDMLSGGAGSDGLFGGNGADALTGGSGSDVIDGGAGIDTALFGSLITSFADSAIGWVVSSGDGNDILQNVEIAIEGGGQRNLLVGATGYATLQEALNGAEDGDNVRLATGTYTGTFSYDDEDLTVIAQPNAQINATFTPTGTQGIAISGANLADTITTGAGDDLIDGGGGADAMSGGAGDDAYYVDVLGDSVTELSGEGRDVVYASASYGLAAGSHVEVLSAVSLVGTAPLGLYGNELAQEILGNAGANVIRGGGGADALLGLGGNDEYYIGDAAERVIEAGGGGRDVIYASVDYVLGEGSSVEVLSTDSLIGTAAIDLTGNELAQELYGNAGANILNGGDGSDYLFGGAGADTFAFTTALGSGNVDAIADFSVADDVIALDDAVFTALTPGALAAGAFVTGTSAQDADDRIIYDAATGQLYYDADGNGAGAQVLFATLNGAPALTASDFIVI